MTSPFPVVLSSESSCAALVERWQRVLTQAQPVPMAEENAVHLEALAEQALMLLTAEALVGAEARVIGHAWAELTPLAPADLLAVQDALAEHAQYQLSAAEVARCQPRLIHFLGELALGFLETLAASRQALSTAAIRKMGHDLKTPINAITGFSKVILKGIDGPTTDFQREDLTSIYNGGMQLLQMIEDLTAVMRQDEAASGWSVEAFDVVALVGDVVKTLYPLLERSENMLRVQLSGPLGTLPAPLPLVRWSVFSALLVLNRRVEHGDLALVVQREPNGEGEQLVFEATGQPVCADLTVEAVHKELALAPTERFCRELGGTCTVTVTEGHVLNLRLRFPMHRAVRKTEG